MNFFIGKEKRKTWRSFYVHSFLGLDYILNDFLFNQFRNESLMHRVNRACLPKQTDFIEQGHKKVKKDEIKTLFFCQFFIGLVKQVMVKFKHRLFE